MNGCCVPGVRKIHINTKGEIRICERIDESAPILGSISTGIDNNRIKSLYLREYEENSIKECSNCWAIRLCEICYANVYKYGRIDNQKKAAYCRSTRDLKELYLKVYTGLLEMDMNIFNDLKEMELI
jgi:uncharacterized protein